MTSLHSVVPTTPLEKAGSLDLKSDFGKGGLDWFSLNPAASFASLFAGILNPSTPNAASNSTPSNPISQLTSLVQSGTPISTIVNTIAQSLSSSIAKQYSGKLSQSQVGSLQSSLLKSITNALSPPANAPPGTAAQQVAALAARLQNLVSVVARETETTAGQQNEIAGSVLDANSAKELPAQQKTNQTSSPLDVSSLTLSLLAGAVATLSPGSAPSAPPSNASAPAATGSSTANQPLQSVSAQGAGAQSSAAQTSGSAESAPLTIANAPDLLARMLVRAASADPSVSSGAGATTQPANQTTTTPVLNATTLAAKFAAAIASAASDTSADSGGSQTGTNWFGRGFVPQSQAQSTTAAPSTSTQTNIAAVPSHIASQVQLQQQLQQAPTSAVDVNSVIEQMVKSMSMRTNASGTSEIRLNLQPENLGTLTMKISVSGTQISANVIAQNADVRSALMSNHQQLAKSLSNAGLTLTGFSVDVSGGDSRQQNNQQNQGQAGLGRRYTVHELNGATSGETAATSALGPPLDGGSGVALFNYLA